MTVDTAEARTLLETLVSTRSVTGEETACAERLREYFTRHDRTAWIDDVGNVRAPGDDAVLLTSHLDTVPGTIPVRVTDGTLWGRGSVDAKGSVAAMAVAAIETGASFVAVVGEETDSRGARHLLDDRDHPDAVINGEPSGWDAITLAYRGFVSGQYTTETTTTHSSRPDRNAIQQAIAWWHRIETTFDPPPGTRVVEQVTPNPVAVTGGTADDGFTVDATVDAQFRIPLNQSIDSVQATVESELVDGDITWRPGIPATTASPRSQLAGAFRRAIRASDGTPQHLQKTGTSDMNVYATTWDCPMVTYGPGDSTLDHSPQERLPLPEYDRSITVLTDVCTRLIDQ